MVATREARGPGRDGPGCVCDAGASHRARENSVQEPENLATYCFGAAYVYQVAVVVPVGGPGGAGPGRPRVRRVYLSQECQGWRAGAIIKGRLKRSRQTGTFVYQKSC
jgi:hypothetical protein